MVVCALAFYLCLFSDNFLALNFFKLGFFVSVNSYVFFIMVRSNIFFIHAFVFSFLFFFMAVEDFSLIII